MAGHSRRNQTSRIRLNTRRHLEEILDWQTLKGMTQTKQRKYNFYLAKKQKKCIVFLGLNDF